MFRGPRVHIVGGGVGGMIVGHLLTRALRKLSNRQQQQTTGVTSRRGMFGAGRPR